jgi:chromosome segregation ATPase
VDESIKIEKTLNKEVEDMRARFTQISTELETSYQTARQFSNDLSKQKHVNEQLAEQIESMIKEKRRHSDEVENLSNQLMDAQSKIIDLERKIKSVESERQKVENDLDDMKDAHQSEASRSHTLQIQFDKLKSEHERRLQEKEDEIDSQKTALKRALEQTNTQLEDIENRHKADLANLRKKTAGELEELKTKVEDARKSKLDAEASLKKLQQTNKELTDKITEEEHLHDETTTQLTVAEKKIATLKVELDETKALLDRVSGIFFLMVPK